MILTATGQRVPEKHAMSMDKLKRFMEFEQILRECGWSMVCRKCANFIAGDNDPGGTRISVRCSCAEHIFSAEHN